MKLKQLLSQKSHTIISAKDTDLFIDSVCKMNGEKIGSILIQTDAGKVAGIVTERDVLRLCATRLHELSTLKNSDVMTKDLLVLPLDATVDDAMKVMTERKFRHLPVVEADGKIAGIVSIGDLVKMKLEEAAYEAKYLREYITG